MSLSQEPAYSDLRNDFVCGFRDIMNEPYAGNSGTHLPRGNAIETMNGSGSHNIQMFVMNSDGIVLHVLPGYWNPADLAGELAFAQKLNGLYNDHSITPADKISLYRKMQLDHIRTHSPEMVARSHLQHFDMQHEAKKKNSDTIKNAALLEGPWNNSMCEAFKTTDVIMHERMAKRPFLPYNHFDVAKFADYGTTTYDKHEDNLDESGHHIADAPLVPIKNHNAIAALRKGTMPSVANYSAKAAARRTVRTYGTVRVHD